MIIKQIKVKNFMSIKEEITWDNLHKQLNIICGSNGSGKSTFLQAIRFVLTDEFLCSSQEERLIIMNNPNNFARVDVISEDPSGTLSNEEGIVCLVRILNLKRDILFINNKRISKSDFFDTLKKTCILFEQPFYIVPQGQVRKIALISNQERQKIILKNSVMHSVNNEKNYSEKLIREQNQMMERTKKKFEILRSKYKIVSEKISDTRRYERLKEKHDTISRIIVDRENKEIDKELIQLKEFKSNKEIDKRNAETELSEVNKKKEELEKMLKNSKNYLKALTEKKQKFIIEKDSFESKKQILQSNLQGKQRDLERICEELRNKKSQLEELIKEIDSNKLELEILEPKLEEAMLELKNLKKTEVIQKEEAQKDFDRKAWSRIFCNKEEKDKWIENELRETENWIEKSIDSIQNFGRAIQESEEERTKITKDIESTKISISEHHINVIEFNNNSLKNLMAESHKRSENLTITRERRLAKERELEKAESELNKIEREMKKFIPKKIADGIESVKKVLQALKEQNEEINGFYGLVIDLFHLNKPELKVAFETAGGNRLFEHVIETADLAMKILDVMNNLDLPGEATFLILDKLYYHKPQVVPDTLDFMNYLNVEPRFVGAIYTIFGRYRVCKNLESAYRIAREFKFDTITLEGDQIFKDGRVCGGFSDYVNSPLILYTKKKELEHCVEKLQTDLRIIQEEIMKNYQKITGLKYEIENISITLNIEKVTHKQIISDLTIKKLKLNDLNEKISELKVSKNVEESRLELLQMKASNFKNDINMELTSQFTEEERMKNLNLLKNIDSSRNMRIKKENQVNKLREEKENVEYRSGYLKRVFEELKNEIEEMEQQQDILECRIQTNESKLIDLGVNNIEFHTVFREFANFIEIENEKTSIENELETEINPRKDSLELTIWKFNDEISSTEHKIHKLNDKKLICQEKIKSLRYSKSLARDFLTLQTFDLKKQTHQLNSELQQMLKVISRTYNIFQNNIDNIESHIIEFEKEVQEITPSNNYERFLSKIEKLAESTFAVEFDELSHHFNKYFQRFKPKGKIELTKFVPNLETDEDDGIDIRICISGQKPKYLNVLSGGEKGLVSICLIFALAKIRPPPFFIFDEIDEALSEFNAGILAEIIHEISRETQCFVSTFNLQLVEKGDRFFKVSSRNKISKIESIYSVKDLFD